MSLDDSIDKAGASTKPALTEAQRALMQNLSDDPHEEYAKCGYCGTGGVKRGFQRTCCEAGADCDRKLGLPCGF